MEEWELLQEADSRLGLQGRTIERLVLEIDGLKSKLIEWKFYAGCAVCLALVALLTRFQ